MRSSFDGRARCGAPGSGVLNIEEHYAQGRECIPEGPRKLLRQYIDAGRLGLKSGRGFYRHDV